MIEQTPEHGQLDARSIKHRPNVMPAWSIWTGACVVVAVAAASTVVLFSLYGAGTPADKTRLEIIKIAGSIVFGTGGAAALLLAARRQRSAELALIQTERDLEYKAQMASDNRHDAIERRATELYTAAAEQLGSDKAPVRLAGLYALQRFGQANPEYRQTVVNLLCSYLRMPFVHPDYEDKYIDSKEKGHGDRQPILLDLAPSLARAAGLASDADDIQRQEIQVRLTAQRILNEHLQPYQDGIELIPSGKFWEGMSLDLAGAVLVDFDLGMCQVESANFEDTWFYGKTEFGGVEFKSIASFELAKFFQLVLFEAAQFNSASKFQYALFGGKSTFEFATFFAGAGFRASRFIWDSNFCDVRFNSTVDFSEAQFQEPPSFEGARRAWDLPARKFDTLPNGWLTKAPDNAEAGVLDDLPGVWGFIVPEDDLDEV